MRLKSFVAINCVILALLLLLGWLRHSQPVRTWQASEVPISFWAWRSEVPNEKDLRQTMSETGARLLFLRAGQLDYENDKLRRIRCVAGTLPRGVEIHLVYNATRSLLASFERLDAREFASTVSSAYGEDAERARLDKAILRGLQLDIDVPTRLLPGYEKMLVAVREGLPQGTSLSITGLPTWMDSPALERTLSAVDFWIPQCYGAAIPETLNRVFPISSSEFVARTIERARGLNRPFYAGLPAYGYAIHYARNGSLLALRGDLDPSLVARDSNFELVARHLFDHSREWRYVYRAMNDCMVDGNWVRAGEWMMLDLSSSASLRESARMVREKAGDELLGICVFRLPAEDDKTTLTVREIACALADIDPFLSFNIGLEKKVAASKKGQPLKHSLRLTLINDGSTGSLMGTDAMTLTLRLPQGIVRGLSLQGFDSSELLCEIQEGGIQSCGPRRANLLKLMTTAWPPAAKAFATIELAENYQKSIKAEFHMKADDAREVRETRTIEVRNGGGQ